MKKIEEIGAELSRSAQTKNARQQENEMLESSQGLSWSNLVFEELEWRIEDARDELVV